MTCKQLLTLLLAITFLSGCIPKHTPENFTYQQINWSEETPASIKTRLQASTENLQILSAFFSLTMNPPPKKMMSSLSGVITIDNRTPEPKVRIQAFHLFGSILFDMVNADGETRIYVPRKNTMYTGKQQTETKKDSGPQTIFANMMLDANNLVVQQGTPLTINRDLVTLHLQDGWLTLDRHTGLITTRHKENLDIHYNNYTSLARTIIPTTITIKTTDGSFSATCSLSRISRPDTLPENYFKLTEYKPKAIMDLQELQ